MDSEILNKGIDSVMEKAIAMKAMPRGQVLVDRDQKVVFYKAYAEHVYNDITKVKKDDLYDLASVTKISTTMAALIKWYEDSAFKLDGTLADHLLRFNRSSKKDISHTDILTHQAQFQPWFPFWRNTLRKNGGYKDWIIKKDSSSRYPFKIANNMCLHKNYPDKIVKGIRKSDLRTEKEYVSSDFFSS